MNRLQAKPVPVPVMFLKLCNLLSHFRLPLTETNLWCFRLRVDDWFAICVSHNALRSDPQIPALNGLAGQLNELLGVLRGIKQRGELANRTPPIICSTFFSTSSIHSASGIGSTPPGAFTFLRVPLVRFLASASATSRVIPNTANVLMTFSNQAEARLI